jgi:flagellin-like protein
MQIQSSYKLNKKFGTSLNNKKVKNLACNSLRSRKAISPILATLLLVVIAVAAIVVTYAWVMTYTGHLTGQAGVVLNRANVRFYGNGSTTKIDIDIQDTGTSDTTIIQVYVGTSSSTMDNQTITPVQLPAGTVQRITLNYQWQIGTTYYFKVITSTGQSLPWSEQAPNIYS